MTSKVSTPNTTQSKVTVSDLNEPLIGSDCQRNAAKIKVAAQYGLVPPKTHVNEPAGYGLGGSFENLVPLSGPIYWD